MASCMYCGEPALAGMVFHKHCHKRAMKKTIAEQFCDTYCRFPRECRNEASLAKHCDVCPMKKLIGAGT